MAWLGTVTFTISGKYNFGDLNRENENLLYLKDQLESYGYLVNLPNGIVSTYGRGDLPLVTTINLTREGILELIEGFYPTGGPIIVVDPNRIQSFNFTKANALEQNLQLIYDMLIRIIKEFKYSGEFSSGEDLGVM